MLELSTWDIGASMGLMFADIMLLIGVGAAFLSIALTGLDVLLLHPRIEPARPLKAGWLTFLVCMFMAVSLAYSSRSFDTVGVVLGFSYASFVSLLFGLLLVLILATGVLIVTQQRRHRETGADTSNSGRISSPGSYTW